MQAILITAYKNYPHLTDLINFFDDNYSIYIHIDKKSSITDEEIKTLKENRNIKFVSQTYNINWGGINHLKAILLLCKEALMHRDNITFHLITGHDYPIKTLQEFSEFHQKNKECDFIEFFPLPYDSWPEGGLDRLSRYNLYDCIDGRSGFGELFVKRFSKLQKAIGFKRKFYRGFPSLYGGSTYWSLKRKSLNYIFSYIEKNPKFLKRFRYSFCSEEIFFQTILLNSSSKDKIRNDNLRFIVWEERNGNFPANLDETDYEDIIISKALFARKFEYPISNNLLIRLKSYLKQKN